MLLYPSNPCISAFLLPVPHHPPTSTVPDSAKLHPTPPLPPINPSAVPSVSPTSGNGKRAPSGGQPQTAPQHLQTLLQQRYPPREVPPRFRQQEHKQLLKRGQPLPSGTLPVTTTGLPATTESAAAATPSSPSCSSSSTASLPTGQPRHSVGESLPLASFRNSRSMMLTERERERSTALLCVIYYSSMTAAMPTLVWSFGLVWHCGCNSVVHL